MSGSSAVAALIGFAVGIFLGVSLQAETFNEGLNEACASVCDDYGWWSKGYERCICAKESTDNDE